MDAYEILYPTLAPLVNKKAYPNKVPEQADGKTLQAPYIVFSEIDADPDESLDEYLGEDWTRVQIDVYHNTKSQCKPLVRQVVAALKSKLPCQHVAKRYMNDESTDNLARYSLDFEFWTS